MDLNSGRLITRRHFPEIPITSNVIKAVETMASKQGFVWNLRTDTRLTFILPIGFTAENVDEASRILRNAIATLTAANQIPNCISRRVMNFFKTSSVDSFVALFDT